MTLTRRHVLLGATSSALLPVCARAQDEFRSLEARTGKLRLAETAETDILGGDGQSPGPLLRLKRGDELRLRLVNKLNAPTSLHFRGIRGPNAFDGVAPLTQKAIAPGASFDYRFTPPDAGVFLYHAHADANFAEQTARGLHGLLIVDEPDAPEHDHEVVAVIADWKLDNTAQLSACSTTKGREAFTSIEEAGGVGRIGALITINGKPAPQAHSFAPGERVWLRLAAATTARLMALTFEGAQPFITAIDGQNCDEFEPVQRSIPVGPGARFDIMFDMPLEGQEMKVILRGGTLGLAGETDRAIITFASKGEKAKSRPPIKSAPANPLVRPVIPLQNAKRLDLVIERVPAPRNAQCLTSDMTLWKLNGKVMRASDPPLFSVKRGTPVTLGFLNQSSVAHVMRLYGHVMRQLHLLDDGWEPYWRDSVIVAPGRTVRIAFVADNPGRWRLGSGILDHAVAGLGGWFEVT
ncbi:multicopper oxidase family protein [Methylocella sp. CPCC 101449]|uniref:multicopper oxidase family protein n=1 Tax=Methylocella sp. CPCC 101449 TaxID=2987531 RepID=UPI00288CC725|nr:multicopper oxidase family protein [Methylocella sp. CPCC 101449]MDT2024470.1 multicopper oxidase family protein [Methylocella sp. CPCC 101449]